MEHVFHGSSIQGLQIIQPNFSTFLNKNLVYASVNFYIASLFLDKTGGDFLCTLLINKITEPPIIVERVPNGLNHRYKECGGSIYVLEKTNFINQENLWNGEMITFNSISPIEEIEISNVLKYIQTLIELKKIKFVPYCIRKKYVNNDNSDLLELFQAQILNQVDDQRFIDMIDYYHPEILELYRGKNLSKPT